MRKDYLFAGIAIIITVILVSRYRSSDSDVISEERFSAKTKVPTIETDTAIVNSSLEKSVQNSNVEANSSVKSKSLQIDIADEVIINFRKQMETVMKCLEPSRPTGEVKELKPILEDLVSYLNEQYGQFVVNVEDWSQIDYAFPDGSQRRIRIDTLHREELGPEREISVLSLGASGNPELLPLDRELAVNPTDDFIASQTANGKEILNEQSKRFFFPGREELTSIERNGIIESFSFSKNGRTATCSGLDTATSNCQCL